MNIIVNQNTYLTYRILLSNFPLGYKHFIKERRDSGTICIPYIPSSQQIADILTKGLLKQNFDSCEQVESFRHLRPNLRGSVRNSELGYCWKPKGSWDLFCPNFLLF